MTTPSPVDDCRPERIQAFCEALGFSLDADALSALTLYLSLLIKWNRVMNLVGPTSWEDILGILVADSLHLVPFVSALDLPDRPLCWDLGSGAGLPGLPLRMLWKNGEYTLVEARAKRALFLRTVLSLCPLDGVTVFQGRAERFMPDQAPAHLIVSRAFMPWDKLLTLVEPYVAVGGYCVFLALDPLPLSLPGRSERWTAAAQKQYTVADDTRYFWALRQTLIST